MEKNRRIYALGFFDGVHLGHQALLRSCRELAGRAGIQAGVVTFAAHPDTLVLGQTPALINTPADRERLLRGYGMDGVITLPFDANMRSMPWEAFLRLLMEKYRAAGFVCGADFRFGHRGQGNARLLGQFCRDGGIPFDAVPEQTLDGIRVSSTHIRALLEAGEMEAAVRFLGHPHVLSGPVVSGRHLGRTLGIPTANLALPEGILVPRFGVYACLAHTDGGTFPAVTNVGIRPTVAGHHVTVEPWLLDFDADLYGREITLEFYKFLRPEKKFPTLEALREEILKNAREVRNFFGNP